MQREGEVSRNVRAACAESDAGRDNDNAVSARAHLPDNAINVSAA